MQLLWTGDSQILATIPNNVASALRGGGPAGPRHFMTDEHVSTTQPPAASASSSSQSLCGDWSNVEQGWLVLDEDEGAMGHELLHAPVGLALVVVHSHLALEVFHHKLWEPCAPATRLSHACPNDPSAILRIEDRG